MNLSDFLLARIAEDEAVARAATHSVKWWDWAGRGGRTEAKVRAHEDPYVALNVTNGDAAHIARHDPARVLAECDAKRRIVVRCQEMQVSAVPIAVHLATQTLGDLALPYAGHPDYRDEWRL